MNRSFSVICLAAICGCLACGGDSDSDGEVFAGGRWQGTLALVDTTCTSVTPPSSYRIDHTATQSGDTITLIDQNGASYQGDFSGGSSFTADGTVAVDEACTDERSFDYGQIENDQDGAAVVELRTRSSCGEENSCTIRYSGTASRTSNSGDPEAGGGTPTPTPDAGDPAEMALGCRGIIERTASGTYAGDGACGISEVTYRHVDGSSPERVDIEPFGANGLASFIVDATNPAVAVSSNTNLTVKGEAGYTCALTCSPPNTFTVRCTKEGSTSCTEKF